MQNQNELVHRSVKVYLPARNDIPFFYDFVDLCADYGYNCMVFELGGAMEYKNHPEINAGWEEYCKKFMDYQGQSLDIQNEPRWARNSIHMENGGGSFLTQTEVRELIGCCREKGMSVIPEMPSLSHCDYLLFRHPELRERAADDLPDTYCPSNPKSYELLFDLLDEVIEVFEPDMIQIGHDEWMSVGLCERCRDRAPADILADDIIRIHDYLAEKGIQTAMWGDKLLNALGRQGQTWGGSRRVITHQRTGEFLEEIPATWEAIDKIPRDIVIYHWYWSLNTDWEDEFLKRGFPVVLANFDGMAVRDWPERRAKGILGVSISNWSLLNQEHLQRNDVLFNLAYTAELLRGEDGDFRTLALRAAHGLYQYRKRKGGRWLEFLHRTTLMKEHVMFVDGYMIDKPGDYLGKYLVRLDSGKTLEVPLYYNLNIGTKQADFTRNETTDVDGLKCNGQLFEATYSCDLEDTEQGIFYRFGIELPPRARVVSVALLQDSQYGETIQLREISMPQEDMGYLG